MNIQTKISLINEYKNEHKKDKLFYLKLYRLKKSVSVLNDIAADIANGKLTVDNSSCALIDNLRWHRGVK